MPNQTASQERRRQRRLHVELERHERQAVREAVWKLRHGRRVFSYQCRRGDSLTVAFDFSKVVIVEFDMDTDSVDTLSVRVALQKHFVSQNQVEKTSLTH